MFVCSSDSLIIKQNNWNVLRNHLISVEKKTKNNPNSIIMLGDYFNARAINWGNYAINPNVNKWAVHEKLLEIITDNDLTEHQMEPSRLCKILDLFLTNRPMIVQNMQTLPGMLDHDIRIADCDIHLSYNKKTSRKITMAKRQTVKKFKWQWQYFLFADKRYTIFWINKL